MKFWEIQLILLSVNHLHISVIKKRQDLSRRLICNQSLISQLKRL